MEEASPTRRNRGKSSGDEALFGSFKEVSSLQQALADMHYLLSKDYPLKATLALVGNRYRLRARQQLALQGMSASQTDLEIRKEKELGPEQLSGKTIYLDGFNILILLETLLSGGYIFKGLDGCYRDISSVHGTYRKVNQTEESLILVGDTLHKLMVEKVVWVFDKPVSNSGRLKTLCYDLAHSHGYNWEIILDNAPDKFLVQENCLVSTSDAWVLNHCAAWFNLGGHIIKNQYPENLPATVIQPAI